MTNPLISIIVPVYLVEDNISTTIDSILAQTYKNIEVILVDDGSPDKCPEIIDNYSKIDNRVKVIHKENGGVTSARIRGVRESSGEWIGFVDGDDYIEPTMYEHLLANAQKYDADISHCGYQMVFPSFVRYYYNTGRIVEQSNEQGQVDIVSGHFVEPGLVVKLFKRKLFDKLLNQDIMDTSIEQTEDRLMNYYLFKESKISIYEDFCPYHYTLRSCSASQRKKSISDMFDPIKVYDTIINDSCIDSVKNAALKNKYRILVSHATMPKREAQSISDDFLTNARKSVKELRSSILHGNFSNYLKIISIWASAFPTSYGFVHRQYAKLKMRQQKKIDKLNRK